MPFFDSVMASQPRAFRGIFVLALVIKCIPSLRHVTNDRKLGFPLIKIFHCNGENS
jgi:hypothetical protein